MLAGGLTHEACVEIDKEINKIDKAEKKEKAEFIEFELLALFNILAWFFEKRDIFFIFIYFYFFYSFLLVCFIFFRTDRTDMKKKLIFNPSWIFLIFLLNGLIGESDASSSVYLHIDNEEFVNVLVGNPGSILTLRLTYQCDYTIKLFSYPNSFSLTHVKYPYETMAGNIIVYLGNDPYRFHVNFDPMAKAMSEPEYDYVYHGLLCLAKPSQLWLHWTRYTHNPRALILGEFFNTLHKRHPSSYVIDLTDVMYVVPYLNDDVAVKTNDDMISEAYIEDDEDGIPVEVEVEDRLTFILNMSSRHTMIPSRYYHHFENFSFGIEPYGHDGRMVFEVADATRSLPNGFDEWLITTNPYNNTIFVMGTHVMMRSFTIYVDWVTEKIFIKPSHDHLFPIIIEHRYTSFLALFSCIVLFFWITDHSSDYVYFSIKEAYCIAFSLIIGVVALYILRYQRYVDFITLSHHHFWIFVAAFSGFALLELVLFVFFYKTNTSIRLRLSLIETLLSMIIWLLLIPTRGNVLEQLTFLFITSYPATSSLFTLLISSLNREYIVFVIIAAFSNFFYIYFTIMPILNINWFGFHKHFSSVLLIWSGIVGLVLIMLHSEFIINSVHDIAKKRKMKIDSKSKAATSRQTARDQSSSLDSNEESSLRILIPTFLTESAS